MWPWFEREIVGTGRLALFVCFAAFIVTFVTTRTITRMIRSGRGPFKDNVSASGMHVHHAVPGVILLVAGAFAALTNDFDSAWSVLAGLLIGVGTSLVLDEFALILHLDDVYWTEEGRVSIEIVSLAVACLGLLLVGINPFVLDEREGAATGSVVATVIAVGVHLALVITCLLKGKYRMALFGTFVPFLALIGGLRVARPNSRWAKRWYSPAKLDRAVTRAARHDARWDPIGARVSNVIAGKPTEPDQPPAPVES